MNIIAVSGGSGSGKSTTLSGLDTMGYGIISIKTARSVLADWHLTLQEVYADVELTMKFQDELIERKFRDEENSALSVMTLGGGPILFTERTYADLFAFTTINLGKHSITTKWLDQYYKKCIQYQQSYSQVFYLRSGHFKVEADGTRIESTHYVRFLDLAMEDATKQMTRVDRLTFIDTPSLEQRLDIISTTSRVQT